MCVKGWELEGRGGLGWPAKVKGVVWDREKNGIKDESFQLSIHLFLKKVTHLSDFAKKTNYLNTPLMCTSIDGHSSVLGITDNT